MTTKNYLIHQILTGFLTLGLLTGCAADALDQTNGDLNGSKEGMVHLAAQLKAQGDNAGAAEFYARALQRAPNDEAAHKGLAEVLEAEGDDADAALQYDALVKLDDDNIDYRRGYGRVLVKLNRPEDARAQYEAALGIDSNDSKSLDGLGVALDLLGDHAGAQEKYKAALAIKPDNLATISNLGHSYVLTGNYNDAIKVLEPHARDTNAPAVLRQNLAQAYGLSGMDADAARIMKMDMTAAQVKQNLNWYRQQRSCVAPTAAHSYAELGSFSTPDLAMAHADRIKEKFGSLLKGLAIDVAPTVKSEGGTPDFYVHVTGFKTPMAVTSFCAKLKKDGSFCKLHEDE